MYRNTKESKGKHNFKEWLKDYYLIRFISIETSKKIKPKRNELIKYVKKNEFKFMLDDKGIPLKTVKDEDWIKFYKDLENNENLIQRYVFEGLLNNEIKYKTVRQLIGNEVSKKIKEKKYGNKIKGSPIKNYVRKPYEQHVVEQATKNLKDMQKEYRDLSESRTPLENTLLGTLPSFHKSIETFLEKSNEDKIFSRIEDVRMLANFYCDEHNLSNTKRNKFNEQVERTIHRYENPNQQIELKF